MLATSCHGIGGVSAIALVTTSTSVYPSRPGPALGPRSTHRRGRPGESGTRAPPRVGMCNARRGFARPRTAFRRVSCLAIRPIAHQGHHRPTQRTARQEDRARRRLWPGDLRLGIHGASSLLVGLRCQIARRRLPIDHITTASIDLPKNGARSDYTNYTNR